MTKVCKQFFARMSYHKRKRERLFQSKAHQLAREGAEEHWRCPAFCAVVCGTVFNVGLAAALLGYYWLQQNG